MVDSHHYPNSKPSSSSPPSETRYSAQSIATVVRQRHSAPASYHTHSHNHRRQDYSRRSLFELLQYLIVFILTYLKIVLQRIFPYGVSVIDNFVDIPTEPIITEPPSSQRDSQQFLLPPPRASTPKSPSPAVTNCQRPCCRSSSVSTDHNSQANHYSNIDELVQDRYQTQSLSFPLSLFPLNLIVSAYRNCLNVNRFIEISRFGRYYKSAVQMRDRFRNLFRWRPTSPEELDQAENKILSHLKCLYKTYYVDIGKGWDLDHVLVWTLEVPAKQAQPSIETEVRARANSNPPAIKIEEQFVPAHLQGLPLVMVHGFASGVALWSLNLDELSLQGKRHIFAFDLLGFAKSSRPKWTFPKFNNLTSLQQSKAEAEAMEEYMVDSIEKWRRAIGGPLSEKFVLLGHSFGGYLCTAYALRYPEHVAHVILADPWGFPADSHTRDRNSTHYTSSRQLPLWLQFAGRLFLDVLTPLAGLRAAGPWGPKIINALRPDLKKKFSKLTGELETSVEADNEADNEADISSSSEDDGTNGAPPPDDMITNYIYHCNAHCRPSGEIAFKKLCTHTGWARMPMLERVMELEPHITLSFIYGSRSWIDRQSGFQTKYILATAANSASALAVPNSSSDSDNGEAERVNVHIMQGSGHHVYADNSEEFNQLVMNICTEVDCVLLQQAMEEQGNEFEWDEDDDDSFLQQQMAAGMIAGSAPAIHNVNWIENGASSTLATVGPNSASSKLDLQQNTILEEDSY